MHVQGSLGPQLPHAGHRQVACVSKAELADLLKGQRGTLEAKAREERVSDAWAGEGARLATISAFALPPSESCSSIVSLEFLRAIKYISINQVH